MRCLTFTDSLVRPNKNLGMNIRLKDCFHISLQISSEKDETDFLCKSVLNFKDLFLKLCPESEINLLITLILCQICYFYQ